MVLLKIIVKVLITLENNRYNINGMVQCDSGKMTEYIIESPKKTYPHEPL